jgi:hypothetical protein
MKSGIATQQNGVLPVRLTPKPILLLLYALRSDRDDAGRARRNITVALSRGPGMPGDRREAPIHTLCQFFLDIALLS